MLFLVAAMFASAAVLLAYTREITFLLDDWDFLLYRPGFTAHSILDPHNEHIAVAPVLIYKALLAIFGMDSARPFQVAAIGTFLASAALLFAWLRGRVGDWLALGATLLVLFCGAAWEDLLWAFQIGYFGSMAAGLGSLLALRRDDRTGDRLACALLVAVLRLLQPRDPVRDRRRRRGGHRARLARARLGRRDPGRPVRAVVGRAGGTRPRPTLSLANLAAAPKYVFDSIASGISSLLGLATPRDEAGVGALDWGRPLAALALVLGGVRLYRLGSVPRWLWVVGAIALSYWLLAAVNLAPGRDATASRYQYIGGIFLLLIAAELVRGVRLGLGALAVGAASSRSPSSATSTSSTRPPPATTGPAT